MPSTSSSESGREPSAKRTKGDKEKKEKKEKKEEDKFDRIMSGLAPLQALPGQMAGLSGQLGSLQAQVGTISADLTAFKTDTTNKVNEIQKTLDNHAKQIDELKNAPAPIDLAQSAPASSNARSDFVPKGKRKCVVVRGFPFDTLSTDIVEDLRGLLEDHKDDIADITAPGKLSSIGKIFFKDSNGMWGFLKAMKGKKLKSIKFPDAKLTHSIDQTVEERVMYKRTMYIIEALKTYITEHNLVGDTELRKVADGDGDKGYAFVHLPGALPVRVVEYLRSEGRFVVCAKAAELNWENFGFQKVVDEANQLNLGR